MAPSYANQVAIGDMRKNPVLSVEGVDQINRAMSRLDDRTSGRYLQEAAFAGAEEIRSEIERRAPRDENTLADNIAARAIKRQLVGRAIIDIGPTRIPFYARFLEFGTSKMRAQPWMRPAFESRATAAASAVVERLRKLLFNW